jgi:excinuclease UvrABC nuclease subunit
MIYSYDGHYTYGDQHVRTHAPTGIGVYYCGRVLANGNLQVLYVGKATSEYGIRGRLLDHIREDYWPLVTHFGYCLCSFSHEVEQHEANEIKLHQPHYNTIGK